MKFTSTNKRAETTTIDGYSNAKTLKGALCDIGRYIEKHIDRDEGRFIQVSNKKEAEELINTCSDFLNTGYYAVLAEEVGCGTRYIDDETAEYCDANYYVCVRIVNN